MDTHGAAARKAFPSPGEENPYSLRTRRRCPESGRQEHSLVAELQFKTRRKWKALRIAERYESGTHKSTCSTHTSPSLPTFTLCWYITTRHFHHRAKKTLTIPVESYEGVGQPFSPKTLLHNSPAVKINAIWLNSVHIFLAGAQPKVPIGEN